MKTIRNMIAVAGFVAAGAGAQAGFFADFEGYTPGTRLQGVDGWKGWDNVANVAGQVSNSVAFDDSANSLMVTSIGQGTTDAVHQFSGATSGKWSVSAMQYLGSNQGGSTYFILMNKYSDGANNDYAGWSAELRFDLSAGYVYDDFRGGAVAIATDEWASIRVDIDLTANTVKSYYNDMLISSGAWTTGGSSANAIAAIDLYTGAGNTAYYDDISLASSTSNAIMRVPGPGALATTALAGMLMIPRRRRAL